MAQERMIETATISMERLKELELYEKAVEQRVGIWIPTYGKAFIPDGGDKEIINEIAGNLRECESDLNDLRKRLIAAESTPEKKAKEKKWWSL